MPVIFLIKNISCGNKKNDSANCSDTITKKIKSEYPELKDHENYHISILHEKNNHLIFFCVYEKNGFAVCCHSNAEIEKPNQNYIAKFTMLHNQKLIKKGIKQIETETVKDTPAKKYTGKTITLEQIKKVLE